MKNIFYLKSKKTILLLKLTLFLYKIDFIFVSECPISKPFKKNGGECTTGVCSQSSIDSGERTIENDIIEKQWFTCVSKYSDISIHYSTIGITPNGDMFAFHQFIKIISFIIYTDLKEMVGHYF